MTNEPDRSGYEQESEFGPPLGTSPRPRLGEHVDEQVSPDPRSAVARGFDDGPIMIAAFAGWNDAGNAATEALQHLADVFDSRLHSEIDPEPYVDFQVNRPTMVLTEEGRHILWPATRVELADTWERSRRLVLVHGVEPSMRWRSYYQEILRIADATNCNSIILLGALLGEAPHTRQTPIEATTANMFLQEHLELDDSEHEGPTGIVGVLSHYAELDGISCVNVWATVPQYVPNPPAAKAAAALVAAVEILLGEPIPRYELDEDAAAWERGVQAFVASDPDLAEYVQHLEAATDAMELPEATGESIAREFEQFLKRRGGQDPNGGPGSAGGPSSAGGPHSPGKPTGPAGSR